MNLVQFLKIQDSNINRILKCRKNIILGILFYTNFEFIKIILPVNSTSLVDTRIINSTSTEYCIKT